MKTIDIQPNTVISIAASVGIGLVSTAFAWILLNQPFWLVPFPILKKTAYAFSMEIPILIIVALEYANIFLSDNAFLALVFFIQFLATALVLGAYFRQPKTNRNRFARFFWVTVFLYWVVSLIAFS